MGWVAGSLQQAGAGRLPVMQAVRVAAGGVLYQTPPCSMTPLPPLPPSPRPQDSLFEEAALLRQRELELKSRLSGAPEAAPVVPVVEAAHIEQVCWGRRGGEVVALCGAGMVQWPRGDCIRGMAFTGQLRPGAQSAVCQRAACKQGGEAPLPPCFTAPQVVSAWTGVPVERMSEDDRDRLLTLADALKANWGRKGSAAGCWGCDCWLALLWCCGIKDGWVWRRHASAEASAQKAVAGGGQLGATVVQAPAPAGRRDRWAPQATPPCASPPPCPPASLTLPGCAPPAPRRIG